MRVAAGMSALVVAAIALTGCSANDGPETSVVEEPAATITIETNLGEVEVDTMPESVAVLDNTSFETIRDLGITPVAVPFGLLPSEGFEDWIDNPDIADVGDHGEPDFEALAAAEPDLIIGGYRFTDYQAELEEIAPTIDVSGNSEDPDGHIASFERQTLALGQIFGQEDAAQEIVDEMHAAIDEATEAFDSSQTVFLAVVTGGVIDSAADRIGPIIEPLGITDVFADSAGDGHGESGLAAETIAQVNPDWAIVLDRDAAIDDSASPAMQVLEANEAIAGTTFMQQDQVILLEPTFYLLEGPQAYTRTWQQLAEAFGGA